MSSTDAGMFWLPSCFLASQTSYPSLLSKGRVSIMPQSPLSDVLSTSTSSHSPTSHLSISRRPSRLSSSPASPIGPRHAVYRQSLCICRNVPSRINWGETHISLVSNHSARKGNRDNVYEGDPHRPRGPAEVLVAVHPHVCLSGRAPTRQQRPSGVTTNPNPPLCSFRPFGKEGDPESSTYCSAG